MLPDLGIETLDPTLQAIDLPGPILRWGSRARSKTHHGSYCLYVDDLRFDAIWKHPDTLVRTGCRHAVEPNFSTYPGMPGAEAIWAIYRKRITAWRWQSAGVRVAVDLHVAPEFRRLNLIGVPREWRAFATRIHVDDPPVKLVADFDAAAEHVGTDDLTLHVFGRTDDKFVRRLCESRGWKHHRIHREAEKAKVTS